MQYPQQRQMMNMRQSPRQAWQSQNDATARTLMLRQILELLKVRESHHPTRPEWLRVEMGKQVEESLYRSASSFEEYDDKSTLKRRLQLQILAQYVNNKRDPSPGGNNGESIHPGGGAQQQGMGGFDSGVSHLSCLVLSCLVLSCLAGLALSCLVLVWSGLVYPCLDLSNPNPNLNPSPNPYPNPYPNPNPNLTLTLT
jgi:hypothetical protein